MQDAIGMYDYIGFIFALFVPGHKGRIEWRFCKAGQGRVHQKSRTFEGPAFCSSCDKEGNFF